MGKRKLSPEEQAANAVREALCDKRQDETFNTLEAVFEETRLRAVKQALPDYQPQTTTAEGDDGNEDTCQGIHFDDLPKWLADMVESAEGERWSNAGSCHSIATLAASEAAKEAAHAAWLTSYPASYREVFAARFEKALAKREGRWDYENDCVKQPNVIALRHAT